MYKSLTLLLLAISLMSLLWMIPKSYSASEPSDKAIHPSPLKVKAFSILETKCNVCHRKKNPFMIFKMKNMDQRANKINEMVFVYKRMPKGEDIKLSTEEKIILKDWINQLNQN